MSFTKFKTLRIKHDPEEILEHIKQGLQPYNKRRPKHPLPCFPEYHAIQIARDIISGKRKPPKAWPPKGHPDPDKIEEKFPVKEIKRLEDKKRPLDPTSEEWKQHGAKIKRHIDEYELRRMEYGSDPQDPHNQWIAEVADFAEACCEGTDVFLDDAEMMESWVCLWIPEDDAEFEALVANCDKRVTFRDVDIEDRGLLERKYKKSIKKEQNDGKHGINFDVLIKQLRPDLDKTKIGEDHYYCLINSIVQVRAQIDPIYNAMVANAGASDRERLNGPDARKHKAMKAFKKDRNYYKLIKPEFLKDNTLYEGTSKPNRKFKGELLYKILDEQKEPGIKLCGRQKLFDLSQKTLKLLKQAH